MNISYFSRLARRILHYGLFASIVHATMVLLYARVSSPLPPMASFELYFPMIENSIVCFIFVLLGALACLYIEKKLPDA